MSLDIALTFSVNTGGTKPVEITLYEDSYTHNVRSMWRKAGVHAALYDSKGKAASEIVDTLLAGIDDMESKPAEYIELNPPNGWGSYERALPWLHKLAAACKQHPKAIIDVWA